MPMRPSRIKNEVKQNDRPMMVGRCPLRALLVRSTYRNVVLRDGFGDANHVLGEFARCDSAEHMLMCGEKCDGGLCGSSGMHPCVIAIDPSGGLVLETDSFMQYGEQLISAEWRHVHSDCAELFVWNGADALACPGE